MKMVPPDFHDIRLGHNRGCLELIKLPLSRANGPHARPVTECLFSASPPSMVQRWQAQMSMASCKRKPEQRVASGRAAPSILRLLRLFAATVFARLIPLTEIPLTSPTHPPVSSRGIRLPFPAPLCELRVLLLNVPFSTRIRVHPLVRHSFPAKADVHPWLNLF
jgi:hypothetical protein